MAFVAAASTLTGSFPALGDASSAFIVWYIFHLNHPIINFKYGKVTIYAYRIYYKYKLYLYFLQLKFIY